MNAPAPLFTTIQLPDDHISINGERYYTFSSICKLLNICPQSLYNRYHEGKFQAVMRPGLSKMKVVHEDELKRYLRSCV